MNSNKLSPKTLWSRRFAYGGGDAACNIVVGMLSSILVLFYTDYVGLNAAIVGTIMLISKFVDGAFALIMGFAANKTRSRYGKYRPWLLWSAVPFAVSLILLFTVPMSTGVIQYIYVFIVYNLCTCVFYNAINVPYASLSYVMTRDSDELNMLGVIRMCCANIGKLMTVCGTMSLIRFLGDSKSSWITTSALLAAAAIVLLLICFFFCEETVEFAADTTKEPLTVSFGRVLKNRYFWASAGFLALQSCFFVAGGTSLTYFNKYLLGNDGMIYNLLYILETVAMIVSMLLTPLFLKKYSKRQVCLASCFIGIAGQLLLLPAPSSMPLIIVNAALRGACFGPFNSVLYSFVGETVEYGYWKDNVRQESLITASCLVGAKIGFGVMTAITTGLLSLSGYISTTADTVQTQPASVLSMITNVYIFGPLAVFALIALLLAFYDLEKKMPQIMSELQTRQQG